MDKSHNIMDKALTIHCQHFAHNIINEGLTHKSTVSTMTVGEGISPLKPRPRRLLGTTIKKKNFLMAGIGRGTPGAQITGKPVTIRVSRVRNF